MSVPAEHLPQAPSVNVELAKLEQRVAALERIATKEDLGIVVYSGDGSPLSTTTSYQDIPDATVTLPEPGDYLIVVYAEGTGFEDTGSMQVKLVVDGATINDWSDSSPGGDGLVGVSAHEIVTTTTADVVAKLQGRRFGTTAGVITPSRITAIAVNPA